MQPARQPAKAPQATTPTRAPVARPPPKAPVSQAAALRSRVGNAGMQQLRLQQRAAERPPAAARKAGPGPAAGTAAPPSPRPGAAAPAAPAERSGAGKATPAAEPRGKAPAAAEPKGKAVAAPGAKGAEPKGKAPAAGAAERPEKAGPVAASAQSAGLGALKTKVAQEAGKQAVAPAAAATVAQAQAAAVAPGPAAQTEAAATTVGALATAPTAKVEADAFKQALRVKLQSVMPQPKDADEAKKALDSGAAQNAGGAMQGELNAQQQQAVGGLPAAAANPAAPGDFPQPAPPPLAPLQPGAPPAVPAAAGAAPPPVPAAALDTSADRKAADAQLAGAGVSEAQLARANEPAFASALASRSAAAEHGETAPALVRAQEGQVRASAETRAGGLIGKGLAGLGVLRAGVFGRVGGERGAAKANDEAERQRIAARLSAITLTTRKEVTQHLTTMESGAKQLLASGLTEALQAFEAERAKLELRAKAKMAESSFFGSLSMLWSSLDKADLDAAVAGARAAYQRVVDRTIDLVATYVGNVMAVVKATIARGRAEADAFVKALPEAVRGIGEKALSKVSEEFDKLSGEVDSRRDQLIDDLGTQFAEASQKVEESVEAFRQSNKSLWDRAKEAVDGILKTIEEMKKLLASIAAKAAGVADKIMDDPIGFLGNLIAGVRKGLDRFTGNFLTHLKAGFFEWLFGQAAEAGIEIPKKFDAAGIFSLIAGVLGLTLANFKARAVQKLGAPFVAALETGAEIFLVWKNEGFAGLWRMLKEKLEAMKEQALEQIQSMLMTQVIEAGVMWLIGLLNPAAALIKACKAIYEIVMFFVNNGKRILEFVSAVLDSLADIVAGKIDGAAAKVEAALARTIPLAIGFLASLLGLGKISEKVKKIIAKLQAPVNKAIDWLLDKAVALVKVGGGALRKAASGLFDWARAKTGFKDETGHGHTIYIDTKAGAPALMIQSTPVGAKAFVDAYLAKKGPKFKKEHKAEIAAIHDAIEKAEAQAKKIAVTANSKKGLDQAEGDKGLGALLKLNQIVGAAISALVDKHDAIPNEDVYLLEGVTGTYGSMPGVVGDKLEADHQPQQQVLKIAASFHFFDDVGNLQALVQGNVPQGFAINLHRKRHAKGRTFGGKSKNTAGPFKALCEKIGLKGTSKEKQREKAIKGLKSELKLDAQQIVDVYNADNTFDDIAPSVKAAPKRQKDLIQGIRKRVIQGEKEMINQDMGPLMVKGPAETKK